jgi:hypothetical protein
LKVRDGVDGGYWWVQCATCEHGWQVPLPPASYALDAASEVNGAPR